MNWTEKDVLEHAKALKSPFDSVADVSTPQKDGRGQIRTLFEMARQKRGQAPMTER